MQIDIQIAIILVLVSFIAGLILGITLIKSR
jgi:uncharacterized protein YneF (UPF0154 family)